MKSGVVSLALYVVGRIATCPIRNFRWYGKIAANWAPGWFPVRVEDAMKQWGKVDRVDDRDHLRKH